MLIHATKNPHVEFFVQSWTASCGFKQAKNYSLNCLKRFQLDGTMFFCSSHLLKKSESFLTDP